VNISKLEATIAIRKEQGLNPGGPADTFIAVTLPQAEAILTRLRALEALIGQGVPAYRAYSDDDNYHCAYCYGVRVRPPDTYEHKDDCEWAALIAAMEAQGD